MCPDSLSWAQGKRLELSEVHAAINQVISQSLATFKQSQPQVEVWWSDPIGDIRVDITRGVTADKGYYVVAHFPR